MHSDKRFQGMLPAYSLAAPALGWLLLLLGSLRARVGRIDTAWLTDGFLRCAAAAGVLGVMSWATWHILDGVLGRSLPAQVVAVSLALAAGGIAYVSAALGFAIPELDQLARLRRPLR